VRFVHLFWRWRLLNRVKRSNQIFNLMQYLIPMEQVSQIWTLCPASCCGRPTKANMCPIIVVGQPETNVCPIVVIGQLNAFFFLGQSFETSIIRCKFTRANPLSHHCGTHLIQNHSTCLIQNHSTCLIQNLTHKPFTVATGDALKVVISG
jgi:hypothetical protein